MGFVTQKVPDNTDVPTLRKSKSDTHMSYSEATESTSEEEIGAPVPPDGGWGWVIVFSSFVIHAVCSGVPLTLGVLYVSWLKEFNSSKSETSWIVSSAVAVMCGMGPFAAAIAMKIGYREMAMVGSLLMAFGFFLSSFSNSVLLLILTIGIIAGVGLGLSYLPAIAVPAIYFDTKRSMALGLGTAGSGAGMFFLAPLLNWLVNAYGWRGTMMILAGICLNVCVAAALMRPLRAPKNPVPESSITVVVEELKDDNTKESDALIKSYDINPEKLNDLTVLINSNESIDAPKKKKKKLAWLIADIMETKEDTSEGEVTPNEDVPLVTNDDQNNNYKIFTSDKKDLPVNENQEPVQDKDYLTVPTGEESTLKQNELNKSITRKRPYINKPVKGGPFYHYKSAVPKTSRNHRGHKSSTNKEKRYRDRSHTNINLMLDYAPLSKPQTTIIRLGDLGSDRFLSKIEHKKLANFERSFRPMDISSLSLARSCSDPKLNDVPVLVTEEILPPSMELDPAIKAHTIGGSMHQLSTTKPSELDVDASREFCSVMELHSGPRNIEKLIAAIKPRDVYNSGSIYNMMTLDKTLSRSRRSMYSTSHIRSGGNLSLVEGINAKQPPLFERVKESLKTNTALLRDCTFLLFAISNFLTNLSLVMPMVFIVDRAISYGISAQAAAMLISLNGAGATCGRVLIAMTADRPWMKRLPAYIATLSLAGLATSFSPMCGSSQVLHGLYAFFFGLLTGNYAALCPCVLVDLKGLESVGQSYGMLLFFMGVSTLMGTPLGGLVYDLSGNYTVPFVLHGVFILASGLMLVPLWFKQSKCRTTTESHNEV